MCRLLLVENPDGTDPLPHLDHFKTLSKNSREYQGHGWGCAWLDDKDQWRFHHHIRPIWEDHSKFPPSRLFVAHARSAFRNEGIAVENNMPFYDGEAVFLFNGELRGVRIKADGRIGAEKVFNTIKRFDRGDLAQAVSRGVGMLRKRTRHIRALNFILANKAQVHYCCHFTEDPGYFQLHASRSRNTRIICSQPYPLSGSHWQPVANRKTGVFDLKQASE
ncbi:MAG: hypothetical protein OXG56_05275 [Gammaproteobacteria bacterium]|nr:hypothetical protein [Gammaproteobacteria bacterium]